MEHEMETGARKGSYGYIEEWKRKWPPQPSLRKGNHVQNGFRCSSSCFSTIDSREKA